MALTKSFTMEGVSYDVASLSSAAQMQVANIEGADMEIAHLQRKLALAQTARNAYVAALSAELRAAQPAPDAATAPSDQPKKTRKPRAKS
jgi:hypothetical protein